MNAAEHECARGVESFFHDALAVAALLEIAKSCFGSFAHHACVGCGRFFQRGIEIGGIDAEVRELGRAQNHVRASRRGDDLLRADLAREPENRSRICVRNLRCSERRV